MYFHQTPIKLSEVRDGLKLSSYAFWRIFDAYIFFNVNITSDLDETLHGES